MADAGVRSAPRFGGVPVQLAWSPEDEAFRDELIAFLDAHTPPEMREERGEIEAAIAKKKGVIELIEVADIRGDLHMHTTASDGSNSIEELVGEAKRRGYQYIK